MGPVFAMFVIEEEVDPMIASGIIVVSKSVGVIKGEVDGGVLIGVYVYAAALSFS